MDVVGLLARDHDAVRALAGSGVTVETCSSPGGARELVISSGAGVVLLDEAVAPPAAEPAELVAALRVGVRLLVLARSRGPEAALRWLDAGADDVVPPGTGDRELTARVSALERRRPLRPPAPPPATHRVGDLVVERHGRLVRLGGIPVPLPAAQFALLLALVERAPQPVHVDDLRVCLWGTATAGRANAVRVHVRRLRQALEADPQQPQRLVTVPGRGYLIRA